MTVGECEIMSVGGVCTKSSRRRSRIRFRKKEAEPGNGLCKDKDCVGEGDSV